MRDAGAHQVVAGARMRERAGRVGGVHQRRVDARRRAARSSTASKRSSCWSVNGSSGSSATARWVNTPARRSAGDAAIGVGERDRLVRRRRPTRCMPVSTFRCTGWSRRTGGGERRELRRAVARSACSPCCDRGRQLLGRLLAEHQDRAVDAGLRAARRPPAPARRTARCAPAGERGARGEHRAVAVAVGLHHGPHLRPARPRAAMRARRCARSRAADTSAHAHAAHRRSRRRAARPARRAAAAGRSPATSPTAGPRRRRARRASTRRPPPPRTAGTCCASSAPMMPASTSPVPAVASRSSPAVTTSTSAVGLGDHRGRTLQQHHAAGVGGQPARRDDAIGTGRGAGEHLELAVVRREHRRRVAPAQQRGGTVGVPRHREQAVAVDHRRHRRVRRRRGACCAAVSSSRPRPGPSTSAWNRSSEPSASAAQPVAGSGRCTTSIGAAAPTSGPGAETCTMPAPARCAPRSGQRRGARHAGAAGDDAHRRAATCARRPPRSGSQAATSSRCTQVCRVGRRRRRRGRCRPPRRRRPGRCRAGTAGPASARRTSPCGRRRARGPSAAPVSASTPLGMSTASTGVSPTSGGLPRAVEPGAERGVDHQVGGRQRVRAVGRPSMHAHRHAAVGQQPGGDPPVGAVVARARRSRARCGRTCRPASAPPRGPRPRPARSMSTLDRLRRGRVDGAHLVGRDDRQHRRRAYARTGQPTAGASWRRRRRWRRVSVWVMRQVPVGDARGRRPAPAPRPVTTSDGSPDCRAGAPTPRGTRTRRGRGRAPSSPPRGRRSAPPATAPGRPSARRTSSSSAVNSRSRIDGVRASDVRNRSMSTASTPMPRDHVIGPSLSVRQ